MLGIDRSVLDDRLREAAAWSDERGVADLVELRRRLAAATVRILLTGEAKRGKSTLGNALLGREVLPSGVRPVTAIATTVVAGLPERLVVRHCDGREVEHPLEELADFVTERSNPTNTRGVTSVEVVLEGLPLSGCVLVDTPGVGSVFAHNTEHAQQAMAAMDVAVFVLTADPPISDSERQLLEVVGARSVATFVVLNKADRLSPEELDDARSFVTEVTGAEDIFVCSARDGLAARMARDDSGFAESGVAALLEAITARLRTRGQHDLTESIARSADRMLEATTDRLRLTRAAVEAVAQDRRRDVDLFVAELAQVDVGDQQAQASASWERDRLRRRLDDEAAQQVLVLTSQTRARLTALLAHASTSTVDLESTVRPELTELIATEVEQWRTQWLRDLQQALDGLATRQQSALDQAADTVAASALRLLGARLRPVITPLPVPDVGRFSFDFSPAVGWNTALVEQSRRLLPAPWRRRTVEQSLYAEAEVLVDRQVGRARSDLQRRLEAAVREQSQEMGTRFRELHEGLADALTAATRLESDDSAEQAAHLAALDDRLGELAGLRRTLTEREK